MEKLFYNLKENQFSKEKKLLLWGFSGLFFLAGLGIVFMNIIQHNKSIHISYSLAPFGISLAVAAIAFLASANRGDLYILVDDERIEYRFGIYKPVKIIHFWKDVQEVDLPHKEKKVKLVYHDNRSFIINLNWIEKKKTHLIRKHIYCLAKDKNLKLQKVDHLH
jgi:hypothetical protein